MPWPTSGTPYAVVGDSFMADKPQLWSPTSIAGTRTGRAAYDLHPDGKRVAATATQEQTNTVHDKVVFVFHFADYLQDRAGDQVTRPLWPLSHDAGQVRSRRINSRL